MEKWIQELSKKEGLSVEEIRQGIQRGTITLLGSKMSMTNEQFQPCLIGKSTAKKTAAAIGMTDIEDKPFSDEELNVILKSEPDFFVDLTVGDHIMDALRWFRKKINVPLGCSPTYGIFAPNNISSKLSKEKIVKSIEEYLKTGLDFICLPLGINKQILTMLEKSKRIIPITSRCGGQLMTYMKKYCCENPYIDYLEDIVLLCKKYGVVLDLGDVFRAGCLQDAFNNEMKKEELRLVRKIADKVNNLGVSVIFEGGGHIPLNIMEKTVLETKEIIKDGPLWYGSTLPIDRAVGKDSVANTIGVVTCAMAGVDVFLAVSNSEHYGRPTAVETADAIKDVKVALATVKYAEGDPVEVEANHLMGQYRQERKWKKQVDVSLFPALTNNLFLQNNLLKDGQPCNMCGKYCPLLANK